MKKRFGLNFFVVVAAFWLLGGMVAAQAQETSACENELPGVATALCHAYCDNTPCSNLSAEDPPGLAIACDNVHDAYTKITGNEFFPCEGSPCPCWGGDSPWDSATDFVNDLVDGLGGFPLTCSGGIVAGSLLFAFEVEGNNLDGLSIVPVEDPPLSGILHHWRCNFPSGNSDSFLGLDGMSFDEALICQVEFKGDGTPENPGLCNL